MIFSRKKSKPRKRNPETVKAYYQKNKERFKIHAIRRYHREKGLISDLTEKDWTDALKHFECRCAYCGLPRSLEKEHVVPVSKGGGFTRSNIIPACRPCNQSKKATHLHNWYKHTEHYSDDRLLTIIAWIFGQQQADDIAYYWGIRKQLPHLN